MRCGLPRASDGAKMGTIGSRMGCRVQGGRRLRLQLLLRLLRLRLRLKLRRPLRRRCMRLRLRLEG